MTPEDIFQATKPFVADYQATFPAEGHVTFEISLTDGTKVSVTETGTVDEVHRTHARAQQAAWAAAHAALIEAGVIIQ